MPATKATTKKTTTSSKAKAKTTPKPKAAATTAKASAPKAGKTVKTVAYNLSLTEIFLLAIIAALITGIITYVGVANGHAQDTLDQAQNSNSQIVTHKK